MCQLDHKPATTADHVACHLIRLRQIAKAMEFGHATPNDRAEARALGEEVLALLPAKRESGDAVYSWLEPLLAHLESGGPYAA